MLTGSDRKGAGQPFGFLSITMMTHSNPDLRRTAHTPRPLSDISHMQQTLIHMWWPLAIVRKFRCSCTLMLIVTRRNQTRAIRHHIYFSEFLNAIIQLQYVERDNQICFLLNDLLVCVFYFFSALRVIFYTAGGFAVSCVCSCRVKEILIQSSC